MKIVLAPDKFKGSLTGAQFCNIVEQGILKVLPQAEILKLPLADGGDGTIEVLNYHLKGQTIKVKVHNPLFKLIDANYLYFDKIKTAFIEMAAASGMALLKTSEQNCYNTTSLGPGELILDAINKGAKTIVLGLGGSATNDCGIGMATALGYKFEDKNGMELSPVGKNLSHIKTIKTDKVIQTLNAIKFKVASDVSNPLFGQNGAAYIYGPQKGASKQEIEILDQGLRHISKLFLELLDMDVQKINGAGAAGGMGAGAMVFLKASLQSGIELIKQIIDFDAKIKGADWIVTGEGKLDHQTLSGKTIQGVLTSAKAQKIKVATLCGSSTLSNLEAKNLGLAYLDSIILRSENLEDAIFNSQKHLKELACKFARSLRN